MAASGEETKLVVNQHYDESLEVNDSEEVASLYTPTPRKSPLGISHPPGQSFSRGDQHNTAMSSDQTNSDDMSMNEYDLQQRGDPLDVERPKPPPGMNGGQKSFSDGDSEESESSSSDEDDENGEVLEGAYDPADYEDLTVTQEIKELFQYITRYTPQTIELEHKLKPFNPDYIPAVGDIDAFLKVQRPDNKEVSLGLTVLDEPCAKQSDPTVLDLQLRSISKTAGVRATQVRSVEDADRNPKAINSWTENIEELHRTKPPPNVHYSKSMPDIDVLMQEWPPEVEELLSKIKLPSAELDCSLPEYIDLVCNVLDIPVHKSRIQSLHLLFSLYSSIKELQQFQSPAGNVPGQSRDEAEVLKFEE